MVFNKCYHELKSLLKILSIATLLENIVYFIGYIWKCNVNNIIMDTNNFNKHQYV